MPKTKLKCKNDVCVQFLARFSAFYLCTIGSSNKNIMAPIGMCAPQNRVMAVINLELFKETAVSLTKAILSQC